MGHVVSRDVISRRDTGIKIVSIPNLGIEKIMGPGSKSIVIDRRSAAYRLASGSTFDARIYS
jgi:hypothetical protein